jgi:glycosyltransferase involved in cell wall biosynthesis
MKILQILPKIPYPPVDGHRKSMWGVIKYLAEKGHDITIVCYKQNVDAEKIISSISNYAKCHILDVETKNSIWEAVKNLFSDIPYNLSKYNRRELKNFLIDHLSMNRYDVIHVTNAHMGWVVDLVKSICAAPIVLRQENLELSIMERYYQSQMTLIPKYYAYIQYQKLSKYEPKLCSKFDKCIMISEIDEGRLLEFNPNVNTTVIPLGVENFLLEIEISKKSNFNIAHIGSLDWYPNRDGIDWFLKNIFQDVLKTIPNAKLYLYGNMPKNFVIDAKFNENIIIKGFVENLWEELENISLAIVPLRIGSGIRVKILELLAAGINIISTEIGKEGIPVEDEKEILIADSSNEFSNKIIRFFNGEYDSVTLAQKGRQIIINNYLWNNIAQKFENTYQELIHKNK